MDSDPHSDSLSPLNIIVGYLWAVSEFRVGVSESSLLISFDAILFFFKHPADSSWRWRVHVTGPPDRGWSIFDSSFKCYHKSSQKTY